MSETPPGPEAPRPPRRIRYSGRNPRRWEQKYKEHRGDAETLEKVAGGGKTPAGTHRPILTNEILEVLRPAPGQRGADCTLGFGGHAEAILARLAPDGILLGLDVDPLQLPRTTARLHGLAGNETRLVVRQSNFAGLPKILAELGWPGVDFLLADLGVSSMQIDNPTRGFSYKANGPLDMRMNPERGQPASALLTKIAPQSLARLLSENADEPRADDLAGLLAGCHFAHTLDLVEKIRSVIPAAELEATVRRVFQALRIAVNDEFSALDALLRHLPACLLPGGRAAILTFHSGEDRRVKHAFANGLKEGIYAAISHEVVRPTAEEQRANPRSSPAKLRWAVRG
ncbi:MAG: 16S rRNA (cytosine(1402)-N(4))-methyltransferase RsmH [Verrucomicrobiales bacterium]|nr:16S rRNA (cytosine(1402)-N(4))-methyltransferase RsmH [Verrucomicrobiales bacterium]